MKNFDLDQIKNRKHQELPDEFYKKMQENVLNKTININKIVELKPKTNLNWVYAAAASLALVFGGTYFFQENKIENPTTKSTEQVISKIETPVSNSEENIIINKVSQEITQPEKIVETKISETQKIIADIDANKSKIEKIEVKKSIKIPKPQEQIDFLLENFTPEDMAILAKNSDNDVYLDLYN